MKITWIIQHYTEGSPLYDGACYHAMGGSRVTIATLRGSQKRDFESPKDAVNDPNISTSPCPSTSKYFYPLAMEYVTVLKGTLSRAIVEGFPP